MKSFYLILFFTFGVLFPAETQTGLKTFTNYGSCYQGLKDEKGKILWPADFESLKKIWNFTYTIYPREYCWIAEKNGSLGLINPQGELILPFTYSKIGAVPKGIIAANNNAVSLFSYQGEIILEFDDYSWLHPTSTGYIVEKEDKI